MKNDSHTAAPPPTPAQNSAFPANGQAAPIAQSKQEKESSRTPGLKLFDVFLYPILTNAVVFGMSVGATYLTKRGGDRTASGKLIYGNVGEWFHKRGTTITNLFKKTGMSDEQADMSKMVFFSFADGTVIAPGVKLIEDRREEIAKAIDTQLGTLPADQSVYDKEPKQGWLSVIGGRLVTCSIVVPTAYTLDKLGLNDVMFSAPGRKIADFIEKRPSIARMFGKLDTREIARVSAFEAFYTSVCTAGLYFFSRFLACYTPLGRHNEKPAIAAANGGASMPPDDSASPPCYTLRHPSTGGWKKALAAPAATFTDMATPDLSTELGRK